LLDKVQNLEQERFVEDFQSQVGTLNARRAGCDAHEASYRELVSGLDRIAFVCKDMNLDESPEWLPFASQQSPVEDSLMKGILDSES
jgi:hypothetical protein